MGGQSHTAGPWWLVEDFDHIGSSVQRVYSVHANDRTPGGLPYEFAGLARIPACEGYHKLEANARLIAAAPELLEALKGLLSNAEDSRIHLKATEEGMLFGSALFDTILQARDAIKKATCE